MRGCCTHQKENLKLVKSEGEDKNIARGKKKHILTTMTLAVSPFHGDKNEERMNASKLYQ